MKGVDLYCGGGGLNIGFDRAGGTTLLSADSDIDAIAACKQNFGAETLHADLSAIDPQVLPNADIYFGGPPCQGFSLNGKRDPRDARSQQIRVYLNIIEVKRPPIVLLENVPGIKQGKLKGALPFIEKSLERMGYKVQIFDLNASGWLPQNRQRIFVIGVADGLELPQRPPLSPYSWRVRDAIVSLGDCLYARHVCEYEGGETTSHDLAEHHSDTVARFEILRPGEKATNRNVRLKWDGLCPTLTAGQKSKRRTAVMPVHPQFPRVLSVREAARLQGFPDWYEFPATKYIAYSLIGNSVPPPLAEAVFLSIREVWQPEFSAKILTLKQPWAWAIAYLGKAIENRGKGTKHRGYLYIHAGQSYSPEGAEWIRRTFGISPPTEAELRQQREMGAIVARVRLDGVRENSDSIWAMPGYKHWELSKIRRLHRPLLFKGQLSVFFGKLPFDIDRDSLSVVPSMTAGEAIREFAFWQKESLWTLAA